MGEHHFSDFITAAPPVFLAWLAGRTSTITLGSGVTLLPHHDPVKIAEDFATLDVVSGGRAEVWVGRGVEPYVYAHFGQDAGRAVDIQTAERHARPATILGQGSRARQWSDDRPVHGGEHRGP